MLGLEKAGIDFVAVDMPNANRLTVGIVAMGAEEERRMISKRTTAHSDIEGWLAQFKAAFGTTSETVVKSGA